MSFGRKTAALTLISALVMAWTGSIFAGPSSYIYIREHPIYSNDVGTRVLDEAAARRFLADIPSVNAKEVWFATGGEEYHKSPSCVTFMGVWAYTKPVLSSPGLYRGRVSYFNESDDAQKPTCNQLQKHFVLSVPVASFLNPDDMHPEEAFDGQVPGVFHVDGKISDQQLIELAGIIPKIRDCLKLAGTCTYPINGSMPTTRDHDLAAMLKIENLTQLDSTSLDDGTVHYDAFFDGGSALRGPRAIDIVYKSGAVIDVRTDLEVTE